MLELLEPPWGAQQHSGGDAFPRVSQEAPSCSWQVSWQKGVFMPCTFDFMIFYEYIRYVQSLSLSICMHRVVYDQKKQTLFSGLIFLSIKRSKHFAFWQLFSNLVASRQRGDTYYLQNTLLHREAAGWSPKGCDISFGKYMNTQDNLLNGYFQQMIGSSYQNTVLKSQHSLRWIQPKVILQMRLWGAWDWTSTTRGPFWQTVRLQGAPSCSSSINWLHFAWIKNLFPSFPFRRQLSHCHILSIFFFVFSEFLFEAL